MRPAAPAATILALAGGLAACAAQTEPGRPISPAATYNGGVALSVIATPFYAVAKSATCALTVLVAAPSSAAIALTDRAQGAPQRLALQRGVADNCGGPYYLPPVRPVPVAAPPALVVPVDPAEPLVVPAEPVSPLPPGGPVLLVPDAVG